MHEEKHQSTDQQYSDKKFAEVPEIYAEGAKISMVKFQGAGMLTWLYRNCSIKAHVSWHLSLQKKGTLCLTVYKDIKLRISTHDYSKHNYSRLPKQSELGI